MPAHNFEPIRGKCDRHIITSDLLANRLGDPSEREVIVHLSPQAQQALENGQKLPVIIYLAPFTSSGPARMSWKAFGESMPQRVERITKSGDCPPCIMVYPETFTSLGGNQFVDSPILGNWSTWLSDVVKPLIEENYPCSGFALVGKSSGGYGAIVNAMLKPGVWDAVAMHSGDVGFDLMFKPTFSETQTHIAPHGDAEGFVEYIRNAAKISGDAFHTLMMCAMAASYDPQDASSGKLGINLPINPRTAEVDEQAWQRWLAYDPLVMIEEKHEALKALKMLYIDCGNMDQYNIQYGSRQLVDRLEELAVEHIWEEFEGTHSGIDNRIEISLPVIINSL